MYIILSQKKDSESTYFDDLFKTYHFPARYKNQIAENDVFIYYQGNRFKKDRRIYFGTGKIKKVYNTDEENYYAELTECKTFEKEVPIYLESGYIEQLDYTCVRKSKNPPWQSSIRPLSEKAYKMILELAGQLLSMQYISKDVTELRNELKDNIKNYYLKENIESLKNAKEIISILIELESSIT